MGRIVAGLFALSAVALLSIALVGWSGADEDRKGVAEWMGSGAEAVGSGKGEVELLDWWKPTTMLRQGSGKRHRHAITSITGKIRSHISRLSEAPATVLVAGQASAEGAPATVPITGGESEKITKYYDDMTAINTEPEYDEDEKISEGELANRLGRAIDAHEKCRRHWPHLEQLEAAQEIRVHDARNNLEVANRGMERARKELRDAENLVMAARSEHQTYEHQRVEFQKYKDHLASMAVVAEQREQTVELYQHREDEAREELRQRHAAEDRLKAATAKLDAAKRRIVELEEENDEQLKQIASGEELKEEHAKAASLNIVHGQELHEVKPAKAEKKGMQKDEPLLSHVVDGIVVPADSADGEAAASSGSGSGSGKETEKSIQAKIKALKAESKGLSQQEVSAFASLPAEEEKVRSLKASERKLGELGAIAGSREAVLEARLRRDEKAGEASKKITLDHDKLALARLDERIDTGKQAKARKEIAALKQAEAKGPAISRMLESRRAGLKALEQQLRRGESILAAEGGAVPSALESMAQGKGGVARLQQLAAVVPAPAPSEHKEAHKPRSRAQLKADLAAKDAELRAIRDRMLHVRSKLMPSEDRVAVAHQQLASRTHELAHATRLAEEVAPGGNEDPNEYNRRIEELREERKRADGLLAKAERMLNVAREDTEHTSRSKAAALEELEYATAKLRKYQKLRAQSQNCQMQSWSTIRRLTHRARERKMLVF